MNRTEDTRLEAEADRVSRIYAAYGESARRRRAWAADNPGNMAIRDELFAELRDAARAPLAGDGRILDIGCGRGYWLRRLTADGISADRMHGVDIAAERLEGAGLPPGVELRRADARALPYPGGHFSLVLLFTLLSSLASRADARTALREAARVTVPGGLVIVYEPRIPQPFNRSTLWIRRSDVTDVVGPRVSTRTLTTLPPLVRRLGRAATTLYPLLSILPVLRTHRLMVHERP